MFDNLFYQIGSLIWVSPLLRSTEWNPPLGTPSRISRLLVAKNWEATSLPDEGLAQDCRIWVILNYEFETRRALC